jgi:hypothetical protein
MSKTKNFGKANKKWNSVELVRTFLLNVASTLQISSREEWERLSKVQIQQLGGMEIIESFLTL